MEPGSSTSPSQAAGCNGNYPCTLITLVTCRRSPVEDRRLRIDRRLTETFVDTVSSWYSSPEPLSSGGEFSGQSVTRMMLSLERVRRCVLRARPARMGFVGDVYWHSTGERLIVRAISSLRSVKRVDRTVEPCFFPFSCVASCVSSLQECAPSFRSRVSCIEGFFEPMLTASVQFRPRRERVAPGSRHFCPRKLRFRRASTRWRYYRTCRGFIIL